MFNVSNFSYIPFSTNNRWTFGSFTLDICDIAYILSVVKALAGMFAFANIESIPEIKMYPKLPKNKTRKKREIIFLATVILVIVKRQHGYSTKKIKYIFGWVLQCMEPLRTKKYGWTKKIANLASPKIAFVIYLISPIHRNIFIPIYLD